MKNQSSRHLAFIRDIHEMERIANNGHLTRERFAELHGDEFAQAIEHIIPDPWDDARLMKLDAARERFADSLRND